MPNQRTSPTRRFWPSVPVVRQPQETVIQTFAAGHGWTTSGTGTANLNDVSQPGVMATQHVSLTTDTVGGPIRVTKATGAGLNLTGKLLRVWIKSDDFANINRIDFYAGSANFTAYYLQKIASPSSLSIPAAWGAVMPGQWCCVTFAPGAASSIVGSPSLATIDALQVTVTGNAGVSGTVRIGGITTVPRSPLYPGGVVSFTWDDGWISQYSLVRPVFAARAVRATAYVIKEALDGGGLMMTTAQARELQDLCGWELGFHATAWARHNLTGGFADLSESELHDEFMKGKDWMRSAGFTGLDHMALPRGGTSQLVLDVARQYFASVRGALHGVGHEQVPPAPGDGRLKLRILALDNTLSLATCQQQVDLCAANGTWLIFMGHKADNATSAVSQIKTSDLTALVDYILSKPVPILPVGDVIASLA